MKNLINILIAGPKGLLPNLLISALSASSRFRIVTHIASGDGIANILEQEQIDVALVSPMSSSWSDQMQMFRRLRVELPRVRLVALLASRERGTVLDAFRHGVRGVLSLQHIEFELLCRCLDCVDSGQIWASNEEIGWVMDEFEKPPLHHQALNIVDAAGAKLLTSREEDVVLLVMDGLSNRDIAMALSLSEHTIKNYLFHIFDKLGVSSRTELVAYASRKSYVEPSEHLQAESCSENKYMMTPTGRLKTGNRKLRPALLGANQAPYAIRKPAAARASSGPMYPA